MIIALSLRLYLYIIIRLPEALGREANHHVIAPEHVYMMGF